MKGTSCTVNRGAGRASQGATGRFEGLVALALLGACLLASLYPVGLHAQARRSFETPHSIEGLRPAVEQVLGKIDPKGYADEPETLGFRFLLEDRLLSPYSYSIYGGTISSTINQAIVRVEGTAGDVQTLARVFELEKVIRETRARREGLEPRGLERKNIWIGQGLNFLAPWMAVLYSSYDSPRLTRWQTWKRFMTYFLLDTLVILGTGTDGFRQSYDSSRNQTALVGGLLLLRGVGAVQHLNLARGHNRLVELKYTFYLDD